MVTSLLLLFLSLIIVYFLCKWLKQWMQSVMLVLTLPGPPITPLIGNFFRFQNDTGFFDVLSTAYRKYGSIVGTWLTVIPAVFILHPKHLQIILGSSKLTEKHFIYRILDSVTGNGLITMNGHEWKSHRMFIQPYFKLNSLKNCIPTLVESSKIVAQNLENRKEITIFAIVHEYLMDILHDIILGIPIHDQATKVYSPFTKGQNPVLKRLSNPFFIFRFLYKITKSYKSDEDKQASWQEFTAIELQKLKNKKNKTDPAHYSLLEYLLDISVSNENFKEEDVVNEATAFMLAGQDTLKSVISYTLYYLAQHQNIQKMVVDEIEQLKLESSEINIEVLKKMKFLEQCIKESMRISPAVPILARVLCEDVKLDDYVLPKGCMILASPYATHRIPEFYPDPEKFDPGRFSENEQEKYNFAFIPFSAGPRNCIATKFAMLAIKTLISAILQKYQIHLVEEHKKLIPVYRLTLKAKGGIWLKVEPRQTVI